MKRVSDTYMYMYIAAALLVSVATLAVTSQYQSFTSNTVVGSDDGLGGTNHHRIYLPQFSASFRASASAERRQALHDAGGKSKCCTADRATSFCTTL